MKKILFLLCFFFCFSSEVWATNTTLWKIQYTGILKENTPIQINGTALNSCEKIIVNNQAAEITAKTDTLLTFAFQKSFSHRGTIDLICSGQKYSQSFLFPYIEKITGWKNEKYDGTVTITWFGFEGGSVNITWDSFAKIHSDDKTIYGKVGPNMNIDSITVTAGWLISNEIPLNVLFPKIDYVTTQKIFKKWETLSIYWSNLNTYKNAVVKIGTQIVSQWKFENNRIDITIPEIDWVQNIQVISNYFQSNIVKIPFVSDRPIITQIKEKEEIVNNVVSNFTYIYGKNFSLNGTTQVIINGKNIPLHDKTSSLLVLKNHVFDIWDNFIEVKSNGISSQIFSRENPDNRLPSIWGISTNYQNETHKVLNIFIDNYVKETDTVYYNNGAINTENCMANSCIVKIPKESLYGEFSVWRANYKSQKKVIYDVRHNEVPDITYVSFIKKLPDNSVFFKVYGTNIEKTNISGSIFALNDKWQLDINKSNGIVEWYTPKTTSPESNFSLTISANGYSSTMNISGKDIIEGKTITWPAVLYSLRPLNNAQSYKPGNKVELIGKNFSAGETVLIWWNKVPIFDAPSKQSYPYFVIPDIQAGTHQVQLINTANQNSNTLSILIIWKNESDTISFEYSPVSNFQFWIDNISDKAKPLYAIKVNNKRQKVTVKSLWFQLNSSQSLKNIGTFHLKVNGSKVSWVKGFTKEHKIIFDDFILDVSTGPINIELFKDSDFIEETSFTLVPSKSDFVLLNDDLTVFTLVNIWDFLTHTLQTIQKTDENCVDSVAEKTNCNAFLVGKNPQTPPVVIPPTLPVLEQPTTPQEFKSIQLKTYNFKSKSLWAQQSQIVNLAKTISTQQKYQKDIWMIESHLNKMLTALWEYENAKGKKARQKIALMKFQMHQKEFKKLIK